jgi:hypothetical protein
MTDEQHTALMIHLEYIRDKVDNLEDAVLGNNEHGVKGLVSRVAVLEDRTPTRTRKVAENAGSGLLGAIAAILAAFVRSTT